jgi:magnesium transporter
VNGDIAAPQSILYSPKQPIRTNLSDGELKEALKAQNGLLWVALTPKHEDSPRILSEIFGFHRLAIEDCLNGRVDTPKVDDYGDYLFIVSQGAAYNEAGGGELRMEELDLFLGRNFVVSIKPTTSMDSINKLFSDARANEFFMNRGADFLAHTVLDVIVDDLLPEVEAMDEALNDLEQLIIERPTKPLLGGVLLLKRNILRLRRSILPQRDMVNRLSRGEFGLLIGNDALMFYRDIYDHIVRVEALLDGLRDLADSALSSYLSALNNRMSEIMKALSVVAVIFLPLTLIASIFGTNLDYSSTGLTLEHGFYWMLAAMIVISIAMVLYFRLRGWF